MNGQMSVVVRMIAESFAATVARVNADWIGAKQMHVTHVTDESLTSEERAVAYLTLEVSCEDVRGFVLSELGTVERPELAIATVISTLAVGILGAVETNVLAQVAIEHAAVRTVSLH